MIPYHCTCGKEYSLPDDAAGRRARCRSCGQVFVVPPPASPAEELRLAPEPVPAGIPVRLPDPQYQDERSRPRTDVPRRSFWSEVGWTLLFPTVPHNIAIYLILWLAIAGAPYLFLIPCVGWPIMLLVKLWY